MRHKFTQMPARRHAATQACVAYERYLMKSHKANANNDYDDNGNDRGRERERGGQRACEKESATDAVHNPNDNINANLITVPCLSNMSALVFALPRNCTWASLGLILNALRGEEVLQGSAAGRDFCSCHGHCTCL